MSPDREAFETYWETTSKVGDKEIAWCVWQSARKPLLAGQSETKGESQPDWMQREIADGVAPGTYAPDEAGLEATLRGLADYAVELRQKAERAAERNITATVFAIDVAQKLESALNGVAGKDAE